MSRVPEINLPESLTPSLAAGHPWVYRDHVPKRFSARTGQWVKVRSGKWTGYGLWDEESAVAVRVYSRHQVPDDAWLTARVREAWELRSSVRGAGVTAFRFIYGEGDSLPGCVVDWYAGHAVLVTYAKALGALVSPLTRAIVDVAQPTSLSRRHEAGRLSVLHGEEPPREIVVEEHQGMRLTVDVRSGQKTGLFLDHRDNRQWVREHALGKRVLNLFSYTGGFSVAAALGGATEVTSVDIARPAVEATSRNFEVNGLGSFAHEGIAEDVFEFLETASRRGRKFDLVVCDPPSFAKNRAQLRAAEKAYRRLTSLGLQVTEPGGIYAAASCTSQVSPDAFRQAIADSCRKARVRFQIIRDIGHAPDHPVLAAHPEGRYLKFVAGRVTPQP